MLSCLKLAVDYIISKGQLGVALEFSRTSSMFACSKMSGPAESYK